MEFHPRVDPKNPVLNEQRIILGSFPVWSLTKSDGSNSKEDFEKSQERIIKGNFEFFYGSYANQFWLWYKQQVDSEIIINSIDSISSSLRLNQIGITDVIISCKRLGKSALDKHLSKRTYNHYFFLYPSSKHNLKILCTSKGVMNEMLLNSAFFSLHPALKVNSEYSRKMEKEIVNEIGGNMSFIKNPFFTRLNHSNGGYLECLALPSPGSPYRRLIDFGLNKGDNSEKYLQAFLERAFKWFMN